MEAQDILISVSFLGNDKVVDKSEQQNIFELIQRRLIDLKTEFHNEMDDNGRNEIRYKIEI